MPFVFGFIEYSFVVIDIHSIHSCRLDAKITSSSGLVPKALLIPSNVILSTDLKSIPDPIRH
jgi:hypothetical protein